MQVDISNQGFKYFSTASRKAYGAIDWLGCVDVDGRCGALGLNKITGGYLLFSESGRPGVLDTMEVLQALSEPVVFKPKGRPASGRGTERQRGMTLNDTVVEAARILGTGNLSKGVRNAIEFASINEDAYWKWEKSQKT